jgi:hypothetical protein
VGVGVGVGVGASRVSIAVIRNASIEILALSAEKLAFSSDKFIAGTLRASSAAILLVNPAMTVFMVAIDEGSPDRAVNELSRLTTLAVRVETLTFICSIGVRGFAGREVLVLGLPAEHPDKERTVTAIATNGRANAHLRQLFLNLLISLPP